MDVGGTDRDDETPWCASCPFREVPRLARITDAELALVERRAADLRALSAGTLFIREEEVPEFVYLLVTGWAQRFLLLTNGEQVIIELCFPGDIIGLDTAFIGGRPYYSAAALTDVTVRLLDRKKVRALFTTAPGLAHSLTCRLVQRQRIVDYRLMNLARRNVEERVAALLLYIYARQHRLGLLRDHAFTQPLSQQQIGEIVGAHGIHVNRVLRRLRTAGVVTVQKGSVQIHDVQKLRQIGCFCGQAEHIREKNVGNAPL